MSRRPGIFFVVVGLTVGWLLPTTVEAQHRPVPPGFLTPSTLRSASNQCSKSCPCSHSRARARADFSEMHPV